MCVCIFKHNVKQDMFLRGNKITNILYSNLYKLMFVVYIVWFTLSEQYYYSIRDSPTPVMKGEELERICPYCYLDNDIANQLDWSLNIKCVQKKELPKELFR